MPAANSRLPIWRASSLSAGSARLMMRDRNSAATMPAATRAAATASVLSTRRTLGAVNSASGAAIATVFCRGMSTALKVASRAK